MEAALHDWGLEVVAPITGGRGGLVLHVRRDDDQFVLKAPMAEPADHIAAQEHLARAGVGPRVLAVDIERGLLLMELVQGRPVSRPTEWVPAVSAAQAAHRAHSTPTGAFLPIVPWLRSRLVEQPTDRLMTSAASPSEVDRRDAISALDELEGTTHVHCFIHGDLNVGNILWDEREGIRLIDARGVVGDPAYDFALLAVKTRHAGTPSAELASAARDLGAAVGFADPDRCARWVSIVRAAQV